MSEFTCLFRSHPLILSFLVLCLSPVFVTVLVLFSPLLVTVLLFLLGIAGLARSRRRLGHQRSRRRRKHRNSQSVSWGHCEGSLGGKWISSGDEGLEGEKQNRVHEYLEDQLKNLQAMKGLDGPSVGIPEEAAVPNSAWDAQFLEEEDGPLYYPENCGVRSDVSEIGDTSEAGNNEQDDNCQAWHCRNPL